MKNKIGITAAAALIMLASTLVTNAQSGQPDNYRSFGNRFHRIPDLTDDQKEKITAISEAHRATIDEMREQFRDSEDFYSSNEIKAKMILEQNTHLKNISAVLTKEQLKEFNESINSRNNRSGQKVGQSRRGGRGDRFAKSSRGRGSQRSAMMQHGRRGTHRGYGRR